MCLDIAAPLRRLKAVYDTYAYRAKDAEKIAYTRNIGRPSGNCLSSGHPGGAQISKQLVAISP
jgi:hypothetical protein